MLITRMANFHRSISWKINIDFPPQVCNMDDLYFACSNIFKVLSYLKYNIYIQSKWKCFRYISKRGTFIFRKTLSGNNINVLCCFWMLLKMLLICLECYCFRCSCLCQILRIWSSVLMDASRHYFIFHVEFLFGMLPKLDFCCCRTLRRDDCYISFPLTSV